MSVPLSDYRDLQKRVLEVLRGLDIWPARNVTEYDYTFIAKDNKPGATVYVGGARLRKTQLGSMAYGGDREICIDVCISLTDGWYAKLLDTCDAVETALMDNCVLLSNSSTSREMEWLAPEPLQGTAGSGPHWIKRTAVITRRYEG